MRIEDVATVAVRSDVPLCIWGGSGWGKTSAIKNMCEKQNWGIVIVNLQAEDVLSFGGLPENVDGVMVYSKPWWVKKIEEQAHKEFVVLFIDELNRPSNRDLLNICLSLISEKRIRDIYLPGNVRFVCTSNYGDQTVSLPNALLQRFSHYVLTSVDHKNIEKYLDPSVNSFLHENNQYIFDISEAKVYEDLTETKKVNPRKWEFVSRVLRKYDPTENDCAKVVIEGLLPNEVFVKFISHLTNFNKNMKLEDILKETPKFHKALAEQELLTNYISSEDPKILAENFTEIIDIFNKYDDVNGSVIYLLIKRVNEYAVENNLKDVNRKIMDVYIDSKYQRLIDRSNPYKSQSQPKTERSRNR
jgi:hypothetical protein